MTTKKRKRTPILVSDLLGAAMEPKPEKEPSASKRPKPARKPKAKVSANTAYEFVSPTHGKRPRKGRRLHVVRLVKRAVQLGRTLKKLLERLRK